MRRFEHGGDVYAHPGVVDFSASLNPLGMPAAARQALVQGMDAFACYPDPACRDLTQAIARFEGVDASWVLPCAGATDAFARLCQVLRPARALVCAPCYRGYEQALAQVDCQVAYHQLIEDDGFAVGPDLATAMDQGIDLLFTANPNNPTGQCLPRDVLLACLERAQRVGALVVVDECFIDLSEQGGSTDLLERWDSLVVVKALTKTYALAGLRVGYALCANQHLLERLRQAGQPWAVSVPAQMAGVACLEDQAYLEQSLRLIATERQRLQEGLEALGMRVVPSQTNFMLLKGPKGLTDALLAKGVMVRPCDNFEGLDGQWYRVAVRLPNQNQLLLEALGEVLA